MREAKRRRLERRQALARKYGMLWLSKVREKLKRQKQDVAHYSSFEIYKSLDYTVGGIYVETGQGKVLSGPYKVIFFVDLTNLLYFVN